MKTIQFLLKNGLHTIATLWFVVIVAGCSNTNTQKKLAQLQAGESEPKGIDILYPKNTTIFPPEFPAPNFEWNDSIAASSSWSVFISDDQGEVLIAEKSEQNNWRPGTAEWENIKRLSDSNYFSFTVIGEKKSNKILPSGKIQFTISKDSVGAEIFYRAVTLPFSYAVKNVHTIEWYLGSVNGRKPKKMLDNLPVCGNCHSFSKKQALLAMDVDYGNDKGSYVIAETSDTSHLRPNNIITWSDYKKEDKEPTFGLLSQISPDGNYVLSTVKDLSIFAAVDDNLAYSQLFFPIKGIIGIYDRKNKSFASLDGANNPKYVQSNPTWSPDGKKVVFVKTEAYVNEKVRNAGKALLSINDIKEFSSGEKEFKYDLYTVDFNAGKGGVATPLEGASNNGKSNYFPKFSPDGKWIVFCQAENFMLLQPDSRLYIMPSGGGKPRLMNCNMEEMNSWHSWSPNGRWLVFSSKNKGLYTQLYITHIDKNGVDSPPVLLENLSFEKRAANIPEFYPFKADDFKAIADNFSSTPEYFNRGAFDKMSNKYYLRAYEDLSKAIEIDSNYLESYFNRIVLNNLTRQSNSKEDRADKKKAMELVLDLLAKNPDNQNYLTSKISLLSNMGKEAEALEEIDNAIKIYPDNYKLHELKSSIYRRKDQYKNALKCYNNMLKIDPDKKTIVNNLIVAAYIKLNQNEKALQLINQLINEYPENNDMLFTRAQIMLNHQKTDLAKKDIDFIISKDPGNYQYIELLAQYYLTQGNQDQYYSQKKRIIQLLNSSSLQNKEDVELIFEMASIYMAQNDFQNAGKQYNLILSSFPHNYEALKQKAIINLNRQQWNEAILNYNLLEANYPLEEGFCNNKAIAYIQTGNYLKALEYFDITIQINPANKDAIFNRNKLRAEKNIH